MRPFSAATRRAAVVDGSDLAGAADDGLLAVGVVDDGNLAAFFEVRGAHGMGDRWQSKRERALRRFVISTFQRQSHKYFYNL